MVAKKPPIQKKNKDPLPGPGASEKPYRTIFEHTGLPTIIIEKDSTISLANRAFQELSGYRRQEIVGKKKWEEFVAPEYIDKLANYLTENLKKNRQAAEPYSFGFVDKKKRNHDVVLTAGVIPSTQQFIFSFMEITDGERFEDSFGYNHQQMSGVIYNIPEATFAVDRCGRIIAWNRAIEELTGGLGADLLGKGSYEYAIPFFKDRRPMIIDLIFASDTEIEDQGYTGIQWTGNTLSAETTVMTADGQAQVIREIASPIFNKSGKPAGAIESITDITGLREQELALRVSESRYRTILENTASAIAIIDEDETISYINPEFEKIIGYVRDEIEGKKKLTEFVAPKDLERLQKYERDCRVNPHRATTNHEFQFIRFDGYVRTGFLTITPIPDTEKMVVSLLDITNKTREEDALQRANTKLNSFNYITRHEILNHLTVVKGYIELSREGIRDPPFLLTSLDKELAAANAIQNLITFTRDYQNIGIQPPAWYNLSKTIKTAAASVHMGSVNLAVDIEGVEIYADHVIEKVFFYLIDDAVRFGKVRKIRFFCKESFEELLVICEDDGIGIHPDKKEKIFNRQLFQNSGLDMYLSREIMSITGISIRETGTFGKGARFEIRVPEGAYRFISPH
ncbi:MAG: PAS domain S-box protein [Methanoregula sp.]|nr:PAS domain S-box protein [Methanoregula sp.]